LTASERIQLATKLGLIYKRKPSESLVPEQTYQVTKVVLEKTQGVTVYITAKNGLLF